MLGRGESRGGPGQGAGEGREGAGEGEMTVFFVEILHF